MSYNPNIPIDVCACFGQERNGKYPHWMVMLLPQGSLFGTWIHSTGGPTQSKPYQCTIQANKRANSHGIDSTELLGTISPKDVKKVTDAAKRIPPQQCQMYVVALVAELEKKGLLQTGNAPRLRRKVQMSERAQAYRQENPVGKPTIAHYPPGKPSLAWTDVGPSRPTSSNIGRIPVSHQAQAYEMQPISRNHHQSSNNGQRARPTQQARPTRQARRPGQAEQNHNDGGGCCIIM